MNNEFYYKFIKPDSTIADFVENIGMFHNRSDAEKEVVIMPDGRVDLFFLQSVAEPFHIMLKGSRQYPNP